MKTELARMEVDRLAREKACRDANALATRWYAFDPFRLDDKQSRAEWELKGRRPGR